MSNNNENVEKLSNQVGDLTMDKDYKVSVGGFNFTFTHTGNKTYGDYIRECLSSKTAEELKDDIRKALNKEADK